nr:hypothetical protein [Nocardiopsis xinjiangensis]
MDGPHGPGHRGPQPPPWGPSGGHGGAHPYPGAGPQQPPRKKKRSGCGCGCLVLSLVVVAVLVATYLQVWGVWDWMYLVFDVGSPRQFVWD